jgi:hypothetical protein
MPQDNSIPKGHALGMAFALEHGYDHTGSNVEAPPSVPSPNAPNLPSFVTSPNITAEGAIENQPSFLHAARQAMMERGQAGRPNQESGFTVDQRGQVSKVSSQDNQNRPAGTAGSMKQQVGPDTLLALHTHPDAGDSRPSPQDIQAAKQTGKQIYVESRDGLFGIDAQGNVTHIYNGTQWLNKKAQR